MIITTNELGLCLELHGAEQLWALRAKISVPKDTITDIRYEQLFKDWRKWEVRMPGTNAPRLLMAGSYWTEEGWDFLYVKKPARLYKPAVEKVLVIETNENKYRRIILTTDEVIGKGIIQWWNQK